MKFSWLNVRLAFIIPRQKLKQAKPLVEALTLMSTGFTIAQKKPIQCDQCIGGWKSQRGGLCIEPVLVVYAYTNSTKLLESLPFILAKAQEFLLISGEDCLAMELKMRHMEMMCLMYS